MKKDLKLWATYMPKFRKLFVLFVLILCVFSILGDSSSTQAEESVVNTEVNTEKLPMEKIAVSISKVDQPKLTTEDCLSKQDVYAQQETQVNESEGIDNIVDSLRKNDILAIFGTGPCLENDSIVGNDNLPQIVFDEFTECKMLIDLRVGVLTEYKYLLIFIEGSADLGAHPSVSSYKVGFGDIGGGYSILALELPQKDIGGPILGIAGGFPTTHPLRDDLISYITDLLSLKSISILEDQLEDQFVGVMGADEEMVSVLIEEGILIP